MGVFSKNIAATGLSLIAVGAGLTSCNNSSKSGSNLSIAGGEFDATDGTAKFPGTVYTELSGIDLKDRPSILRNVATIVNHPGVPNHYLLFMSLADALVNNGANAIVPAFKTMDVTMYFGSKDVNLKLPTYELQSNGTLKSTVGGPNAAFFLVGVELRKYGNLDSSINAANQKRLEDAASNLFFPSPIQGKLGNLRNAASSYVVMAIHKSLLQGRGNFPAIAMAKPTAGQVVTLAGYGETGKSESSDSQMRVARNFAQAKVMENTPFSQKHGNLPNFYEIQGSGLCYGKYDGKTNIASYDTGASVYANGQWPGMAIRTSRKSSLFKGWLGTCNGIPTDDLVTLVLFPTPEELGRIVAKSQTL